MLEVNNFSKRYKGAKKYSARSISFFVEDGTIMGLVGSNGAGKSTIIKSIVCILPFDGGKITVNGFDIVKESANAKMTIGYVPDDHSVYEKLTGREYVNYMGSLYGVDKETKAKRLEHYAKLFSITKSLDNQIFSYSHGMKQKICLIGSLIHEPKLWVLDEPMMGLDPTTMNQVRKCIKEYAGRGNSVLFSSHNLDIVEKLCDNVCIINEGRLVKNFNLETEKQDENFDLEKIFEEIIEAGLWVRFGYIFACILNYL